MIEGDERVQWSIEKLLRKVENTYDAGKVVEKGIQAFHGNSDVPYIKYVEVLQGQLTASSRSTDIDRRPGLIYIHISVSVTIFFFMITKDT